MTIKIEVEGLKELRAALNTAEREFSEAVSDGIAETALTIEQQVTLAIQRGQATGRIYQKYNPRRTHQASAQGQPPASDTGALAASIYSDIAPMTATIGSRLAYAYYLEFGTRRMAPRPIWMPTAQREGEKMRDRIIANLQRATQ